MALVNFTLGAAPPATPAFVATSPVSTRLDFDDLLYQPDQTDAQPGVNEPFQPPQQKRPKVRKRAGTPYLPPHPQYQNHQNNDGSQHLLHTIPQLHTNLYPQNKRLDVTIENQNLQEVSPTTYVNSGQYFHDPSGDYDFQQKKILNNLNTNQQRPSYDQMFPYGPETSTQAPRYDPHLAPANVNLNAPSRTQQHNVNYEYKSFVNQQAGPAVPRGEPKSSVGQQSAPAQRPHGFTKVEQAPGGKTQVHAVLDYDDDYYEDSNDDDLSQPAVTPLQGPIFVKNGSVPVVPLTTYPTVNNGSFYQIPILWTALSLALGYELQGQVIRGVPCVKKNFQLYCPTAGNTYPLDKIENFIDENKALIKRMYGSFSTPTGSSRFKRAPGVPDLHAGDTYFGDLREKRQSTKPRLPDSQSVNSTGRVDSCESKTEIITPYWALNSARKLRAIVNTMHFEQAIHQEVCSKKSTGRCAGDCGCEQKYKWHRLLAYDPSDDCAGIFMDWFLFASCCVCRCNP